MNSISETVDTNQRYAIVTSPSIGAQAMLHNIGKIINLPLIREGLAIFNLINIGYVSIFFGIFAWVTISSMYNGSSYVERMQADGYNFSKTYYKIYPLGCNDVLIDDKMNLIVENNRTGKSCISSNDYPNVIDRFKNDSRGIYNNAIVPHAFLIVFSILFVGATSLSTKRKEIAKNYGNYGMDWCSNSYVVCRVYKLFNGFHIQL